MLFTFKISLRRVRENIFIENMKRTVTWKLLHWKYEQDGSVSSLRNTCLPLHHRPGDPAVGGWVTLTDGVLWKFDELWCNSVTQSHKFGWLLKMIFLNLKVGAMELMVFMFNPTHLRQVDVFAHFQNLWPRRKPLALLLKFWPMEKFA